jgi:hypothetical protein
MVAMSGGIAHGMRVLAWQIRVGWKALLRQPAGAGRRNNSHQNFWPAKSENITEPGEAKNRRWLLISERRPCGAALSLAERIDIDFAEPREDHRALKLACRRIAGAGKCQSARVFEREPGVRLRLDS